MAKVNINQRLWKDQIETARFVRILWHCTNPKCDSQCWKMYGEITLESKRVGSGGIDASHNRERGRGVSMRERSEW
jgi:hypothetical protein